MNDLHWFPYQLLRPAGWILLHALWQGAALALLYQGLAVALRHRAPGVRYRIGVTCLLLALTAPPATVWMLRPAAATPSALGDHDGGAHSGGHGHAADTVDGHRTAASGYPLTRLAAGDDPVGNLASAPLAASLQARLDLMAPRLFLLWTLGVLVAAMRLAGTWAATRRLVHGDARSAPAAIAGRLDTLQRRLAVDRPVEVQCCTALDSPALLGWRRPVILLPTAAAHVDARTLDPVLAHELAHVSRHDYPVNVVQAVIECLLFFQPAALWISRRVRAERELCCDDMAAACCDGGAVAYARGLAGVEALRLRAPALAVGDGHLLARIRRLVDPASRPRSRPLPAVLLVAGSLLLTGSATALLPGTPAPVVLGGLDPVALIAGREAHGQAALSAEHGRYRYLFADRDSRARFLAAPHRYAVVNAQFCPVSGRGVRSEIFRVIDGRIVLFCCPDISGSDLRKARALPITAGVAHLEPTLPD